MCAITTENRNQKRETSQGHAKKSFSEFSTMVDEDDDGFGDFTFAPSNSNFRSDPPLTSGHDSSLTNSADDDDDWGDFVLPGGLTHAVSLPPFRNHLDPFRLHSDQKVKHGDSEPTQPGSAPGRASGVAYWKKPTGALPLSIFGEQEEEGNSGAGDPSFADGGSSLFSTKNIDPVKKVSGTDVNDLIANYYKQNDSVPNSYTSKSDEKFNKNEKNSELNASTPNLGAVEINLKSHVPDINWNWGNSNGNGNGKRESTLDSHGLNLDWDPLKLNSNGSNSNKDVAKEVIFVANGAILFFEGGSETFDNGDDDGWEFKDAQSNKTTVDEEISKTNQIKTENGPVVNHNGNGTTWNSLRMDINGWNSNLNYVSSSTNFFHTGLIKQDRDHTLAASTAAAANEEEDDDDDGWEFKFADSQTGVGDDKDCLSKNEPKKNLNLDGLSSIWDMLPSNSSGLNPHGLSSDEKLFTINFIDEKEDSGVVNAWAFKGAEPDLLAMEEKPEVNLNLIDKSEDFWGSDGWEFKTAGSARRARDENARDGGKTPEVLEGAIDTFGFGTGVHGPGDKLVDLQGTSQNSVELNMEFAFSSNKGKQTHTENTLPFSQVDEKLISVKSSWSSKDAFPEAVPQDEGDKLEVENHKRALPLSIFGDEDKEADDLVIDQDSSTLIPSANLRNSIKNSQVDIKDLISSLYGQAVQNTSSNYEQNLGGSGLDSTRNGVGSDLASDNHDFDDESWEFQDASLRARDDAFDLVQKYSTITEKNDYLEFFSKLREELHYAALYHLENLKKSHSAAVSINNGAKIHDLNKEIQDLESELQDNIISSAICLENKVPGEMSLDAFIEALQESKYEVFVSEYQLTKKISLAESDWRSAIDVLKCVAIIVNILKSASQEEQSSYISAWYKMVSVCAQELRHGSFIWKQAVQQNFRDQILSKPEGKKFVLALGEIYRVAKVLGSSAKLYKPWIFASSADSMCIFTLISECSSIWSSSGLEEALQSILSSADFEYDESLKMLLESIKYIDDLDAQSLYSHVFSGKNSTCQLSALAAGLVPGMKTIEWNGKHCFLTLANLWANLVSSEPPNWPCILAG